MALAHRERPAAAGVGKGQGEEVEQEGGNRGGDGQMRPGRGGIGSASVRSHFLDLINSDLRQ